MPIPSPAYHVGLVLAGRRALVVGGGRVAWRKAAGLLECAAEVTVVAPQVDPGLADLPVALERRRYRRGEVVGYALAIAATGIPGVDRAVFEDGEAARILVNAADDPASCSFVLPAVLRRGAVSLAVSTDGTSPALASWLRDRIAAALGSELEDLQPLLALARERVRAAGRSSEGLAWRELIDDLARLLQTGSREDAERRAGEFVQAALGPPPGASAVTSAR